MSKPLLAFLLSDALGWRTYADQLTKVLNERDDFDYIIRRCQPGRLGRIFVRRMNTSPVMKRLQVVDPLVASRWSHGRWWAGAQGGKAISAVHVAAQSIAGAVYRTRAEIPYTVALDHTRVGVERDIPKAVWRSAHVERERRILRDAAHIFPMSRWAAESAQQDYGVPPERVTVIPPSGNPHLFRQRTPSGSPIARVIFIGNDLRRKGVERLIAWAIGPLRNTIELHLVTREPVPAAPGVVVHGPVPNARLISELMPSMDIFCLPSRSDMSPQVLMEAAMAGLPAVASRIGGIPELVVHGETGFLIDAHDENGFVEALRVLATNRDLNQRFGCAAAEHARLRFSAPANFNAVFDRMLALSSARH